MSTTELSISVASRAQTGRSASRRLRRNNQIPAILYGKHSSPETLSVDAKSFYKLHKSLAGRTLVIELQRAGAENSLAFLQEVQRNAMTDGYVHVDFQEVKAGEKFEVRVPIHVVGEAVGVKTMGGLLEIMSHNLRVRCLPKDLPSFVEVDVSELKTDELIKVSQLKPIDGVEFRDAPGQPVVTCHAGEAEEETPAAAAAPAAKGKGKK